MAVALNQTNWLDTAQTWSGTSLIPGYMLNERFLSSDLEFISLIFLELGLSIINCVNQPENSNREINWNISFILCERSRVESSNLGVSYVWLGAKNIGPCLDIQWPCWVSSYWLGSHPHSTSSPMACPRTSSKRFCSGVPRNWARGSPVASCSS